MPRAAPNFGHVQMKAVFFMLLLAGHDCVRVTEEVQWSKSKWDQLHEDCTWSFTKGCGGEGCVRKRLPLDLTPSASCRHTDAYLLKHNGMKNFQTIVNHLQEKSDKFAQSCQGARFWNRKCKRREAQIFEAMMFITRAPTDKDFMSQLDEGQKATVGDALGKTLQNLASSEEERQLIQELTRKMKGHGSEFLKDPEEFSAKATQLVMELLEGSPEEKETAKKEISEMPETAPALSADEEATAIQKLKDMEKEFEANRGDVEHALDEVDQKTNELVEEEADEDENEGGDSALQIRPTEIEDRKGTALLLSISVSWFPILLLALTSPVGWAILTSVIIWGVTANIMCLLNMNGVNKHYKDCVKQVLLAPVNAVKFLAKGAWRISKKAYRFIRGKNETSTVSDLQITRALGGDADF